MKTRELRLMAIGLGSLALVVTTRAGGTNPSEDVAIDPGEAGQEAPSDVVGEGQGTSQGSAPGLGPELDRVVAAQSVRLLDFNEISQPIDVCVEGISDAVESVVSDISITGGQSDVIDESTFSQLKVNNIVYGDLDGDGSDEAVIHTACSYGANGVQDTIEVWGVRDGAVQILGTVPELDQEIAGRFPASVTSVSISDAGALEVVWTTYGESDPRCCPSAEAAVTYQLAEDGVVPVGDPVISNV